jgi:hypothetical protein
MAIGRFIGDAIRDIWGMIAFKNTTSGSVMWGSPGDTLGVFSIVESGEAQLPLNVNLTSPGVKYLSAHFSAANVVPTASENRPASISAYICIKY